MNSRNRLFFLFFLLVTQLVLQLYVCDADAVQGQSYMGDGATNNVTVPPGGWVTSFANDGACLVCHVPGDGFGAPDRTSYLMTGHKNALRMVTPGIALAGTDGQAYRADYSDNTIDWTSGLIDISGFCTNSLFSDQTSCTAGGAIWIIRPKGTFLHL
jgi:hypothetical protein